MQETINIYSVEWQCLGHPSDTYTAKDGSIVMRQHVHFEDFGASESAADEFVEQVKAGTAVCAKRIIPAPNAPVVKHTHRVSSIRTVKWSDVSA